MKKVTLLYFLTIFMGLSAIVEAVSGFVLWLALPHAGGGRGTGVATEEFWNISRTDWVIIHDWVSVALLVLLALHIVLHWKWICLMTKRYLRIGSASTKA